MKIVLKSFEELSGKEVYKIGELRNQVFIVEQNCPYLDLDGKDFKSLHLYFLDEIADEIMCYCRILPRGLSYPEVSIGRVLTNEKYRKKGLARKILLQAIEVAKEKFEAREITIGAQNYLKDFFSSLGFVSISEVYDEDGISHIDMQLRF